ncbi:LamG-like jellyroll fold domain-containing protein [Pedobacter gandavensis]|uniref:LamG-like jellyroll fold domain-containing protein n=1 Tax=Pedobacter gandavensis TaxID=2679963 RepID=UPI0029312052|nr:LamG-like jellyroll fold domain-containing protein [Pedobacter gandavensis]
MKKILRLKFIVLGVILLSSSCNKDFENTLPGSFKNDTSGLGNGSRKVLYIILDGVRGEVVKNLAPENISSITANSTFSYVGLSDSRLNVLTNAAGWANMITGVDYTKHQVTSEDFAGFDAQAAPSIFSRLKDQTKKYTTASFSATAAFNDHLAGDASIKETFPGEDNKVKDAVLKNLSASNTDLVVAQFHGAEIAGKAAGYTEVNGAYISQINILDGYVGEMLLALKGRKDYAKENWLVIVSSNKGGAASSGGSTGSNRYLDASRNTFVVFYNPKFSAAGIDKPDVDKFPYQGVAPNFSGNSANFVNAKLGNTTTGEFGASGDFTLMLKIRVDHASADFAPFIGKTLAWASSTNKGWVLYYSGTSWVARINGGGAFSRANTVIRDGKWHTIALRIYTSNGRKMRTYTDGIPGDESAITANFAAPAIPLALGYIPNEDNKSINMLMKDVAIYNVAIPEAEMIPYMRKTVRYPTDIYYNNLVGYWPCDEEQGAVIKDKSGKSSDFTFTGTPAWKPFSDISANVSPELSEAIYTVVPNGVDIPYAIFNWMNVIVPDNWNLMGKLYLPAKTYPNN